MCAVLHDADGVRTDESRGSCARGNNEMAGNREAIRNRT
jgi:hypothetical protein